VVRFRFLSNIEIFNKNQEAKSLFFSVVFLFCIFIVIQSPGIAQAGGGELVQQDQPWNSKNPSHEDAMEDTVRVVEALIQCVPSC
jgi:hypothetical protein